jgi:predicted metal-dependent HD superfamily phosphohydrolase
MALWGEWREHCSCAGEVGIALWYHDAVYFPKVGDNELRSAAWATRDLRAAGVNQHSVARIEGLVMATCHDTLAEGLDAQVLVDIDLAILGSTPDRFEQSSQDIRKEYDWVPEETYRSKRAEVLSRFAARHRIYNTAAAIARFEAQARENLAAGIHRLLMPASSTLDSRPS